MRKSKIWNMGKQFWNKTQKKNAKLFWSTNSYPVRISCVCIKQLSSKITTETVVSHANSFCQVICEQFVCAHASTLQLLIHIGVKSNILMY